MSWKSVILTCPICGYTRASTNPGHPYCKSCGRRRTLWGSDDAVRALLDLASTDGPLSIGARQAFIERYHHSHLATPERMATFRRSLRYAGYKGEFTRNASTSLHTNTCTRLFRKANPNAACRACGQIDDIQVHHIVPIAWGGDMKDIDNMEYLCEPCHKREHRRISAAIRAAHGRSLWLHNLWLRHHAAEFQALIGR